MTPAVSSNMYIHHDYTETVLDVEFLKSAYERPSDDGTFDFVDVDYRDGHVNGLPATFESYVYITEDYRERKLTAYIQGGGDYMWEVSCSSNDGMADQYETCKRIVDSFQVN